MINTLTDFMRESNMIENINRDPTIQEVAALEEFLTLPSLTVHSLSRLQAVFAPGEPLRIEEGMNVFVGRYRAPDGGPRIGENLERLLDAASERAFNPWEIHVAYEHLHPFMDGNGRTGRAVWLWQMQKLREPAFELTFLRWFYYQTLRYSTPTMTLEQLFR